MVKFRLGLLTTLPIYVDRLADSRNPGFDFCTPSNEHSTRLSVGTGNVIRPQDIYDTFSVRVYTQKDHRYASRRRTPPP